MCPDCTERRNQLIDVMVVGGNRRGVPATTLCREQEWGRRLVLSTESADRGIKDGPADSCKARHRITLCEQKTYTKEAVRQMTLDIKWRWLGKNVV